MSENIVTHLGKLVDEVSKVAAAIDDFNPLLKIRHVGGYDWEVEIGWIVASGKRSWSCKEELHVACIEVLYLWLNHSQYHLTTAAPEELQVRNKVWSLIHESISHIIDNYPKEMADYFDRVRYQ